MVVLTAELLHVLGQLAYPLDAASCCFDDIGSRLPILHQSIFPSIARLQTSQISIFLR